MSLQDGKYFKVSELACHDGTPYPEEFADRLPDLMSLLDKIRTAWDGPIRVVSGYRSAMHNAELAKDSAAHQVASGSYHVQGQAADIRPVQGELIDLHRKCMALHLSGELPELGGIGLYPSSNWVHVDTGHAPDGHLRKWFGT